MQDNRNFTFSSDEPSGVVLTAIRIPFWDLVLFMVKFSFAAIPAAIIVSLAWMAAGMLFGGCMMGMGGHHF